jgi:type I restriction enzyme M protein
MIKALIDKYPGDKDIPDEEIPEAVAELILESFNVEEEVREEENNDSEDGASTVSESIPVLSIEEQIEAAKEKIEALQLEKSKAKQKLIDLESDIDALILKRDRELEIADKKDKAAIKAKYKEEEKTLKDKTKDEKKRLENEIKFIEKTIPDAAYELNLLTNKGKLQIILSDGEYIATLKNRWIDAEVAKKLDYPIFMAVSERGGKNNSGEMNIIDENGNLMDFPDGHPQEGQLIINQDLVNFDLTADDFKNALQIPDEKINIAEAFIKFAQKNNFDFWKVD